MKKWEKDLREWQKKLKEWKSKRNIERQSWKNDMEKYERHGEDYMSTHKERVKV